MKVLRHYENEQGQWAKLTHRGHFYEITGSELESAYCPASLEEATALYEDHLVSQFGCVWVPSSTGGYHLIETGNRATLSVQLAMRKAADEAQEVHPELGSW